MMNGIIAFCGSKGSGKSTSASILKELFKGETEELAFAGHLKTSCSKVFNVDMRYFLDPSLKEVELTNYIVLHSKNVEQILKEFDIETYNFNDHVRPHIGQVFDSPRRVLQYIGTEVLHPLDPLIHAKMTIKNKDLNKLSIVTDLRFVKEFEYLNNGNNKFIPIYVKNDSAEYAALSDTHPSEKELTLFKDKCDILNNNGNLSDLKKNIENLILKYNKE